MECDCKPESACTSTFPCETEDDVASVLWPDFNNVLTGALAILGFCLYRFSQALPALIRWPVRLICSLTGVTSLWSWVSRLVNTIRGLQTLFKWLCHLRKVAVDSLSNMKKCLQFVTKMIQELREFSLDHIPQKRHFQNPTPVIPYPSEPELRLILVGPQVANLILLRDTLLGCHDIHGRRATGYHKQCENQRAIVEGREVTVITMPDILGSSLGLGEVAWEALRGLQLASPGPHAFLLVLQAPRPNDTWDGMKALRALLELVGEDALRHVLPVLTHTDTPSGSFTLTHLLEEPSGDHRTMLSLCGQRPEILDVGPTCPLAQRKAQSRWLLERVAQMRVQRGHYLHELQREEDRMRQEQLMTMASELRRRLERKGREGRGEDLQ